MTRIVETSPGFARTCDRDKPRRSRGADGVRAMQDAFASEKGGRRECRALDAPAALCAKSRKHTRVVTTGKPKHSGIPCAMALRFPSCSSRGPGFFAPVIGAMRKHPRQLDASVGAPEPHDFAVRIERCSSSAPIRPPHSEPNVRDDRDTPLPRGRNGAFLNLIWVNREPKYFFGQDWTGSISLIRFNKFAGKRTRKMGGARRYPSPSQWEIERTAASIVIASASEAIHDRRNNEV
jgi:hypothetical protein